MPYARCKDMIYSGRNILKNPYLQSNITFARHTLLMNKVIREQNRLPEESILHPTSQGNALVLDVRDLFYRETAIITNM